MAPRDAYSFTNFKWFHKFTKRRWRECQFLGGQEIRVMDNNRKHVAGYMRKMPVRGWNHGTPTQTQSEHNRTWKTERYYSDYVGDPYFDYYDFLKDGRIDWWGAAGRIAGTGRVNKTQSTYIPNTPAFDPSINLESGSFMEKIYLDNLDFEQALASTTKKISNSDIHIMTAITDGLIAEGMSEEEARTKAEKAFIVYLRNRAMVDNQILDNDYNFTANYYNKYIDKKIREMMPIKLNFWFLKEALASNPNLSFYVIGPYNLLSRIQGIVSKRDQNVIIKMTPINRTKNRTFDFVYSVSKDTLVNEAREGFVYAKDLTPNNSFISNGLKGSRHIQVERRLNSEIFFDLILEGKTFKGYLPWFDAKHNCWLTPDYSNPKNLKDVDIVC